MQDEYSYLEGEHYWSCKNCGVRSPRLKNNEDVPVISFLLACPFCNARPECHFRLDDQYQGGQYQVCCNECGAEGPFSKNRGEAIENWNAALPRLKALFS